MKRCQVVKGQAGENHGAVGATLPTERNFHMSGAKRVDLYAATTISDLSGFNGPDPESVFPLQLNAKAHKQVWADPRMSSRHSTATTRPLK